MDSEPIELEWILEPEIKEPTPPPEPTPELPPTPAPSPPPKVELHMDALERRMRKAKGNKNIDEHSTSCKDHSYCIITLVWNDQ